MEPRHFHQRRAGVGLALALAFSVCASLMTSAPAWAADPFPVEESFRGPTFGAQWRHGGSAELTGATEAEGWLRLTSAEFSEFGYAYDNEAFPSTDGALVEFEYADWGGSGADGLAFFLFNGDTTEAEFHAGQPGGSLGYAPCHGTTNGLTNAYVGVGFDEYGNFTNLGSICGLDGTEFLPNHVSIRGSESESYRLLATAATAESLRAERSQARRVTIAVTPTGRLSVYLRYPDGTYQKITEGFRLPAAPATLKFGYVASTGGLTDNHEIRDAQVVKPTQLTPSVTLTSGGHERGKPFTWTAVVHNEGPNPTQRERVNATTGAQSLSNVSWTCTASGGGECVTAAGTGLPNVEAGAMPTGANLTYRITGTPTPSTDHAQMTIESEPRADAGELDPEKERATLTTNLTPLFQSEPSFTLTAGGEASATPVGALGGEISYSYAWQLCEASGASCSDITGAKATSYHTTAADVGHTIRFTETATNSAGSATVDSAVYKPLPTVEITSAPPRYAPTTEAVLTFVAVTAAATLECSLDGATWSACSSPVSYSALAQGTHTFSVRALYGELSGAPSSVQWTVESTPPSAPTIVSGPPATSTHASATFKFGGLGALDTLECRLDSGEWKPCTTSTELTALANGQHTLQARQVNRAGVDSSVTSFTWKVNTSPSPSPAPNPTPTHASSTPSTQRTPQAASAAPKPQTAPAKHATTTKRACKAKAKAKKRCKRKPATRTSAKSHKPAVKSHKPTARTRRSASKRPSATAHRVTAGEKTSASTTKPTSATGEPSPSEARSRTSKPSTQTRTPTAKSPASTDEPKAKSPAPTDEPKAKAPAPTDEPKAKAPAKANTEPTPKTPKSKSETTPAATTKPTSTTTPSAGTPTSTPTSAPTTGSDHASKPKSKTPPGANPVIRPFRSRSFALTTRARQLVERLATELSDARSVVCVGYTDGTGARSANVLIGLERAQTVCGKLRALGVHASFRAVSRGEQRPCASNATAAGRALNRRVELRITY